MIRTSLRPLPAGGQVSIGRTAGAVKELSREEQDVLAGPLPASAKHAHVSAGVPWSLKPSMLQRCTSEGRHER